MMAATATLTPACDQRRTLALQVADAVTKVYEARKKYEVTKSRKPGTTTDRLYTALLQARQVERDALHALREHIEEHECAV